MSSGYPNQNSVPEQHEEFLLNESNNQNVQNNQNIQNNQNTQNNIPFNRINQNDSDSEDGEIKSRNKSKL